MILKGKETDNMKTGKFIGCKRVLFAGLICLLVPAGDAQTLIDYFLPMPIVKPLRSDKWGCAMTGKRDIGNGLEDTTNRSFSYWDGPIIKGPDGKYHMFASRWNQNGGHWAWLSSVGIHAVSESIMGPYVDKGLTWPHNDGGKGHNMTILQLKDGTYASVVSDTRPGDFFTAPSLDGPWTFAGSIKIDANGFDKPGHLANLSIIIRPDDGKYMIIERNGQIMTSDNLTGTYKVQCNSIYRGLAPNLEDPVLWYSGGYYHVVVNSWSEKKAFHLRSKDGITNWTNEGLAFDPRSDFLRYTDGTVNHWTKIERPGVYIENGHITHWTFSVIDSEKERDQGNDDHNSKVIVVPFDGVAFDGVAVPDHRDTVYNGKFDAGKIGWTLNVWGGSATGDVIDGEYRAIISSLGENNHDIQLVQAGLILQQGKYYRVSFDAYAASERTLEVNVEMEKSPWTSYLKALETFDLTTTKTTYSFTFKMEHPTDSSGRLGFNFGASTGTVYLDNISIQQATGNMIASGNRRIRLKPRVAYANGSLGIKYGPVPGVRLSVDLFDLKGNVVKSGNLQSVSENTWTYDLSSVPSGIYVAGIRAEGKILSSTRFLHRN
jgi:hypothetical protein